MQKFYHDITNKLITLKTVTTNYILNADAYLNPRFAMYRVVKMANVYCPDGNTDYGDDLHTKQFHSNPQISTDTLVVARVWKITFKINYI